MIEAKFCKRERWCCMWMLLWALILAGDNDGLTAVKVIDTARDCRNKIASYRVVINSVILRQSSEQAPLATNHLRYEAWSDGHRQRCDITRTASTNDPKVVGTRTIWCRNGPRDGYIATTSIGVGYIAPLTFHKDGEAGGREAGQVDWARLGLLESEVTDYSSRRPDDTLMQLRANNKLSLTQLAADGGHVYVVNAAVKSADLEARFRPEYGMNPVLYKTEVPSARLFKQTTVAYDRVKGAELWYPTVVRHIRTVRGRTAVDETLTVELAEINQPISAYIFTEAAFGLPIGTPIGYPGVARLEEQPTWTGESVDPKRTVGKQITEAYQFMEASTPPVPDTPEPGRRWPYYLGGGLLAVVGSGLLHRARRRRTAA